MATKKEYADIKAGVDGLVGDAPAPPSMDEPPEAPTMTTTIQEEAPAQTQSSYEPTQPQTSYQRESSAPQLIDADRIHAIIEATVSEKWDEFLSKTGDLSTWKERTNLNILSLKQELIRSNERFTNLQNAVLGRVKTYDQGIQDIHTEMKALERVFDKIIEPLVSNIKELNRITQDLKRLNPKK